MKDVSVDRTNSWSVAAKPSKAGPSGSKPAFSKRLMPGGRVVHELDRAVHDKALRAAGRKLRALQKT